MEKIIRKHSRSFYTEASNPFLHVGIHASISMVIICKWIMLHINCNSNNLQVFFSTIKIFYIYKRSLLFIYAHLIVYSLPIKLIKSTYLLRCSFDIQEVASTVYNNVSILGQYSVYYLEVEYLS